MLTIARFLLGCMANTHYGCNQKKDPHRICRMLKEKHYYACCQCKYSEPRYDDTRYNDIPCITRNILCHDKSYSTPC